jgi:Ran-binding protein 9/10
LIKELVAQFLAHDGYVETAKAFAEEVQSEDNALKSGSVSSFDNFAVEEDLDAVNRQRISSTYLILVLSQAN